MKLLRPAFRELHLHCMVHWVRCCDHHSHDSMSLLRVCSGRTGLTGKELGCTNCPQVLCILLAAGKMGHL